MAGLWRNTSKKKLKDLHDRVHRAHRHSDIIRRRTDPSSLSWCLLWSRSSNRRSELFWRRAGRLPGFSYGFRAGRSQHDALDALHAGIYREQVNWVLDGDIQGFFNAISHSSIIRSSTPIIADKRILRLIAKMAEGRGTVEDGRVTRMLFAALHRGAVIWPSPGERLLALRVQYQ